MKKTLAAFAAIIAIAGSARAGISAGELFSLALKDAVNDAQASIAASPKVTSDKAIAILPFAEDESGSSGYRSVTSPMAAICLSASFSSSCARILSSSTLPFPR